MLPHMALIEVTGDGDNPECLFSKPLVIKALLPLREAVVIGTSSNLGISSA
jgi:hypothetical protein